MSSAEINSDASTDCDSDTQYHRQPSDKLLDKVAWPAKIYWPDFDTIFFHTNFVHQKQFSISICETYR